MQRKQPKTSRKPCSKALTADWNNRKQFTALTITKNPTNHTAMWWKLGLENKTLQNKTYSKTINLLYNYIQHYIQYMQVPLCDACDTVMTQCCSCRGFVESIFCCLWSSQWLNLLYNYAHCIQYIQVPLCDACDTVMTQCCSGRGLVESIFCCLWSSQWLNLLYNYAHCIQYIQVPLCDACDTVMTQCCSGRGLVESIFCCLWSSQWLNLLYNYMHTIYSICRSSCVMHVTLWWLRQRLFTDVHVDSWRASSAVCEALSD